MPQTRVEMAGDVFHLVSMATEKHLSVNVPTVSMVIRVKVEKILNFM